MTEQQPTVTEERSNDITNVTHNRPHVRNAVNPATATALA